MDEILIDPPIVTPSFLYAQYIHTLNENMCVYTIKILQFESEW